MSFEREFFGPGNRLRWDAIQAGTLSPDVQQRLGPFLEDFKRNPEVLALPRVRDDGRVQWYILCRSARAARFARDEVRSFLGPTYSDYESRPTSLDPQDSVEAAVLATYGNSAFRIEVPRRELLDTARDRLRLLISLRNERPTRYARRIRAAGRVLREFEYALLAGDGSAAADCIEELRSSGHLSATNLLFLEVRRLAASGHWDAILALPELEALLAMVRPRRVTEALVRAVYFSRLQEFEQGNRAFDAIERFRSELFTRFRDLYRTKASISGYEVDASFLMAAAVATPSHPELVAPTLAAYPPDSSQHEYLAALAQLIPSVPALVQVTPLDSARAAFAEADVDRAYELAIALPPSFDRCALLLRCARDMGSLSAARVALESLGTLRDEDRLQLDQHIVLSRIREGLSSFSTTPLGIPDHPNVAPDIPSTWPTWFKRLTDQNPWRGAVPAAAIAAREWSVATFLQDPSAIQQTADLLLGDRPEWGQESLRDALPYFLEFCVAAGADPRLKPVYESLFLTIAIDDQVSLPQVSALLRVTDMRLQLGVAQADYIEMLTHLMAAIEAVESPSVSDMALEAIEILIGLPCPDTREREHFVLRAATLFQRWYRRIDAAEFALLRTYAEELGLATIVLKQDQNTAVDQEVSEWTALDGKKIALYSLKEAALRRVARVVGELCPGARVHTFHDHVGGSPALRAASSTADVFVLATAAAKHAATIFIEACRPKGLVTLYARGQGSASLLDALRRYLVERGGTN
jgi:hypothetical protein